MKPKYTCPQCTQIFSRNWNMREHCRTQHNYDPEPNPRPSPLVQHKTKESIDATTLSIMASAPVEKFLKLMANSASFQQTGIRERTGEPIVKSMDSIENAVNYLLDNFVIVSKKEFHGISGYFCKKCLTFEYRYIRNLWGEKTAKDKHVHSFNMPLDGNTYALKESELRIQANNALIELTNSLLPGDKKFEFCRPPRSASFHGPVIRIESASADHWAGIAILKNGIVLRDDPYIYDFIKNVQGTYAEIIVTSGPFRGAYLIAVKTG